MNGPSAPAPTWTTATTESIHTGTWRTALALHRDAPSPCHSACPVNGEIATWIGQLRDGDTFGAWRTLVRNNPFPAVSGRVCHHPCESACNRGQYDEALSICRLERHVGDAAIAAGWEFPAPQSERGQRVAVVGGGPAGLAAAYHLRNHGYPVTLFEAREQLGGLMRHGIPAYRLARDVLDAEIRRIVNLGVEVRLGAPLAGGTDLQRLREQFDAVYVATGASRPKRLPQIDYEAPWAWDGAEFLARTNAGERPEMGPRVVVIGGGSAAMDVARSARRLGCEVTVLSLERADALPASAEEVSEAREEDIAFVDGAMLQSVRTDAGPGLRLECVRVDFSPPRDASPARILPLANSEFALGADSVVSAIGQDPDLEPLQMHLENVDALVQTDADGATSAERVWAGGDLVSMARFVTEAFGMGKRAAAAIHHTLSSVARPAAERDADVDLGAINTHYHPQNQRAPAEYSDPEARVHDFGEVQLPLEVESALREAERCFSCGTCIFCDNCVHYCPDVAIERTADGYRVREEYCKGCGLCVAECPTGAIVMREERR